MMLPSTAAARQIPRGLGDVSWYCYLFPFASDCPSQIAGRPIVDPRGAWCLDFPSLCTTEEYQAAVALAYPENVYAPIQTPPTVGAPPSAVLTVPPASGEQAQETIDQIIARQSDEWKLQNREAIEQTATDLERIAASKPTSTTTWILLGAAGIGAVLLLQRRG
jgi:hypothetical protein